MRGAVSDTPPLVTPSRSLLLGGAGVLLLCIPFFVFGLAFFDTKARVELHCTPAGPCTLERKGWLTSTPVGTFPREQLRGAKVDRNRNPRDDQKSIYRPVLLTTQGEFPLSAHWMDTEAEAQSAVRSVRRYQEGVVEAGGLTLVFDDRERASRMGLMFLIVSTGVLGLGLVLTFRGLSRRRQERSQKPMGT